MAISTRYAAGLSTTRLVWSSSESINFTRNNSTMKTKTQQPSVVNPFTAEDIRKIGKSIYLLISNKEAKEILAQINNNAESNEVAVVDKELVENEITSFFNL